MSKQSKFLSKVLRHDPALIGVELDREGWVRVDILLRSMMRHGRRMTHDELTSIAGSDDKKRFTLRNGRIRAAYGHSVEVDLGLPPVAPPALLFHGTASQHLDQIFDHGILPGRRRFVHLTEDMETAARVGRRHGKPVVLHVDAAGLHAYGHDFFQSDNGVWLVDEVQTGYFSL
ncbi:RNA 2'-phosphotransferase [Thioclava sp. F28-4]|uniref:RNA 2'-phosphotransferase n=1 Tax=Thioclava sp. F28-4 TaxID=1915315 RepID=UPI0009964A0E|nr:RNA 2'-phosphotransferase [Thioclava sp. F28-4]OOY03040.1 RNA--NAD 2'-phosphotransferase [Thioclava sp. F28-4]